MSLLPGLLLLLVRGSAQDCVIDHRIPEDAWEQKLHTDLINTGSLEPLCNKTEPLDVYIRFTLRYFEYLSEESTFNIYTRVHISWTHDRLTWDPKDYGGIEETVLVSGTEMWYQTFRVLNSPETDDTVHHYNVPCQVAHTGRVVCVPRFNDPAICVPDLTDWPYDRQTCSLLIAPPDHNTGGANKIKLSFGGRAITMFGAEYGAEWMIIDYLQTNGTDTLNMTFVMERHGEGLAAVVVFPGVMLSALTLTALALDPRQSTRASLLGFSVAAHVYFINQLRAMAPLHQLASVPSLVYYYRGSLLATLVALVSSLCLGALCRKSSPAPRWLHELQAAVGSHWTRLLIPRWECGETNNTERDTERWTNVANIANAACLLIFPVVYVSMYFSLVPQPYPITN